jgi:surface antigen
MANRKLARFFGASAIVFALAIVGCTRGVNNQTLGAGVGAVGGALIGSTIGGGSGQKAAMIVGGLIGALVGGQVGRSMDDRDRLLAAQTTNRALETGSSGRIYKWCNPDNGHCGSVRPEPAYRDTGGQICRDYSHTVKIDGRSETMRGVGCRQADGTWRAVS